MDGDYVTHIAHALFPSADSLECNTWMFTQKAVAGQQTAFVSRVCNDNDTLVLMVSTVLYDLVQLITANACLFGS